MELVDRFLSCSVKTSHYYLAERENFQLLSIAAFYVSVKTMERAVFGSDLLVLVSNGVYTKEEIERTEKELLQGLGWRVNPPTATQFACLIMSLVTPLIANMHDELVARVLNEIAYQAENSVRDYSLSQERSSSIAIAAMFNAAHQLLDSSVQQKFLLALCYTLVGNFAHPVAHPKELQMTRLRLQRLVASCEIADEDITKIPANEDDITATQVVAALEVSAVYYKAINDSEPVVNETQHCTAVYTGSREKTTCDDASSSTEGTQNARNSFTSVGEFYCEEDDESLKRGDHERE